MKQFRSKDMLINEYNFYVRWLMKLYDRTNIYVEFEQFMAFIGHVWLFEKLKEYK